MTNSCATEDLVPDIETTKKVCFNCQQSKPLSAFAKNRMKYSIKSDMGRMLVCKDCDLLRSIRTLTNVRFNFETGKFEINYFKNAAEVVTWYEKNETL